LLGGSDEANWIKEKSVGRMRIRGGEKKKKIEKEVPICEGNGERKTRWERRREGKG
jgi:hypothetical protein